MALSDRPFGPVARGPVVPPISLNQQATASGQQNPTLPNLTAITATTETQLLSGPIPQVPLSVAIPPDTGLEQAVFDLYASGYITTTSTTNLTLKLYSGVSTTIASNTLLGSSGAVAQNTATAPWWAHARLIYDSVSGLLCGDVEFYLNKTKVASVTLSNFPTGINNQSLVVAQFSLTLTSSGAGSGTPTTVNVAKFTVG